MSKWPTVALRELLTPADETVPVQQGSEYPNFGMYSFGRGLFEKSPISGAKTSAPSLRRVRAGNFVFSRLFAFEGAYGLVDDVFDGYFVSNEYPSFQIDTRRLNARFLKLYFQLPRVWQEVAIGSKGVGSRRVRVQPAQMLTHAISLPPISEQERIVSHFEGLAEKTRQLNAHLAAIEADAETLLSLRLRAITQDAPVRRMAEIAPAIRRSVEIDVQTKYREVGARSFGKGLFEKPPFDGAEATWQKPVWIRNGDLVLSNIKAWEGAIAVADPTHDGCMASHRYITCVPKEGTVIAGYLSKYLLSPAGLEKIGNASPGTADRNRTLSLTNLGKMEIPVPAMSDQIAFDQLRQKIAAIKTQNNTLRQANDALIPATLERIFLR